MKTLVKAFYGWYKAILRNTKYRWIIVLGTLIYFISPVDIAPDFIPMVGWVDDGILATLLVTELSQVALEYLNKRKQPRGGMATNDLTSDASSVMTLEA